MEREIESNGFCVVSKGEAHDCFGVTTYGGHSPAVTPLSLQTPFGQKSAANEVGGGVSILPAADPALASSLADDAAAI